MYVHMYVYPREYKTMALMNLTGTLGTAGQETSQSKYNSSLVFLHHLQVQ